MQRIVITKINDGDSGAQAAGKIYQNEKGLADAVQYLSDYLDSYGELINITISGGTIQLADEPGDSPSKVMSQRAVTDFVSGATENAAMIGTVIGGPVDMPGSGEYVNLWVSRASANAEGHSLTEMYNDIQDLKEAIENIRSSLANG